MALDPYDLAEELVDGWQGEDDDRPLSEYLLLSPGEYSTYVREDVLPEDFVDRHRQYSTGPRLRIEPRHPLDAHARWDVV